MENDVIPVITETATTVVDTTSLETIINKLDIPLSQIHDLLTTTNEQIAELTTKLGMFMDFMAVVLSMTLFLLVALFVMLAVKKR